MARVSTGKAKSMKQGQILMKLLGSGRLTPKTPKIQPKLFLPTPKSYVKKKDKFEIFEL